MATINRTNNPWNDFSNSLTVPWKFALMVAGICKSRTAVFTRSAASPSEKPGLRLNDTVTAGSCPKWFTLSGPKPRETRTSVSNGIKGPCEERTYNFDNASGVLRYCGSTSVMTAYSLAGV